MKEKIGYMVHLGGLLAFDLGNEVVLLSVAGHDVVLALHLEALQLALEVFVEH